MPPSVTDPAVFTRLYECHQSWLKAWLRRRLRCDDDAADLAQDTFLRLLTARQAAPLREPRAFLTTLAQRVLIDFWRRRELEQAYLESLRHLPERHAPSEETRALILEALAHIDRILAGVPAKARAAFLLSQLDGLTHAEIAHRLNVAEITVRRYIKQSIRACIAARAAEREGLIP